VEFGSLSLSSYHPDENRRFLRSFRRYTIIAIDVIARMVMWVQIWPRQGGWSFP
jgi:hypothetical protein